MVTFRQKGDFSIATKFLNNLSKAAQPKGLERYAKEGVVALSSATPVDTGKTADSWYYKIDKKGNSTTISFHNSNVQNGVPIAIILQYGHATRNGGWVQGRDYINPAIRPVFDQIAEDAWKEVTKL